MTTAKLLLELFGAVTSGLKIGIYLVSLFQVIGDGFVDLHQRETESPGKFLPESRLPRRNRSRCLETHEYRRYARFLVVDRSANPADQGRASYKPS